MFQTVLTIALGAAGWWITNFFLSPIQRIDGIRRDIQEILLKASFARQHVEPKIRLMVSEDIRNLAAKLLANYYSAPHWIRLWFRLRRLHLLRAGIELNAFASSLSADEIHCPIGLRARGRVEVALRLPVHLGKPEDYLIDPIRQ